LHATSAGLLLVGAGDAAQRPVRQVRILSADRPALVLGSSQPDSDIDPEMAAAAGVDVVRRRSGGGAVLVAGGTVVWIDVIIPAGDPLWDADVRRAAWWLGDTWASAVAAAGAGIAEVHRGGLQRSPWSSRVCFAGLGPGEVCLQARKVVGVSQRRTQRGVLFQTAALLQWDPARLLALLRMDERTRAQANADLVSVAVGVGPERAGDLIDAFVAALPPD
jgi:lipoate-protein ligase A